MFQGVVPVKCVEQMFAITDIGSWKGVYVCCSGTLRIDSAVRFKFPDKVIVGNDVSLFSVALGKLSCGQEIDIRFKDKLQWLEDLLVKRALGFHDRVGAVLFAFDISRQVKGTSEYSKKHLQHFQANAEFYLNKATDKVLTTANLAVLSDFYAGDWRQHVEEAIKLGYGILAFPPFFKGEYEAAFKYLHENTEWEAPAYELYNPNDLGKVVKRIEESGVPYAVISDRILEDMVPSAKYTTGRKVPHYFYSNAGKSSVRNIQPAIRPVGYEPVDVGKLTEESHLSFAAIDANDSHYIKDRYLAKGITQARANIELAVVLDGMVAGIIGLSPNKYHVKYGEQDTVYLMGDVCLSTEKKLSKLITVLATIRPVIALAEKRFVVRYDRVLTTARSNHPVSMKYRGIYELISKKENIDPKYQYVLNYVSEVRDWTIQQAYTWWWEKYGSKA